MELDVAAILTQINRNKLIKTTTWKKKNNKHKTGEHQIKTRLF